jgi:hypothetical protein
MTRQFETNLLCERCGRVMAKLWREPTANEGVFTHKVETTDGSAGKSRCGLNLVRADVPHAFPGPVCS